MSALHDLLWTVCRKLPTDFEPYGERDRDRADPCADCSCGCRHFVPLAGDLGHDWGICANAKSPRAGLLTFEHQGCSQFEPESEEIAAAMETKPLAVSAVAAPVMGDDSAAISSPLKKLKVELEELIIALEGFGSGELRHVLDTETGEIIVLSEDADDYEEWCDKIDAADFGRYREIDKLGSHQSFEVMEQFALSLPESRARRALVDALSRNKPFRRFKDTIHAYPELGDQWFAFRDLAYAALARDWLEGEGIEPE